MARFFVDVFDEVAAIVREGMATGEFDAVVDVALTVDMLAGLLGAGASRVAADNADVALLAEQITNAMINVLSGRRVFGEA